VGVLERDPEATATTLARWLQQVAGVERPAVADVSIPGSTGWSNETVLFDAAWGDGDERRTRGLVARIAPSGHQVFPDETFLRQHAVMHALAERTDVPMARTSGADVMSEDRSHFLAPGDEEIGWTARRGRVPLGYLGDPGRTEATFPIIDGERVAIPGDRAQRLADGTIRMLGRDAMVVNTGGEKVFVEEVEAVLRRHPDVADALAVGRPSDRFGQEVVAVVAPREGATLDPGALREFVAADIARFKAPRAVAVCDSIRRHANGKADYRWAQEVARTAVDATAGAR